jgi:hypothetical protein
VTGLLRRRVQWIQVHLNFETWSEREYPQFATRGVRCLLDSGSWSVGCPVRAIPTRNDPSSHFDLLL